MTGDNEIEQPAAKKARNTTTFESIAQQLTDIESDPMNTDLSSLDSNHALCVAVAS